MIDKDFESLFELQEAFPDEQSCIDYLEWIRWMGNVISPFDPTSTVYKCKNNQYRCKNTGLYFNVRTKTMYENSKIPLRKWFMAVWLITCDKKGVSSTELGRKIKVTQKTAWLMSMKIRKCFKMDEEPPMEGTIEVDETYVGGAYRFKHKNRKTPGAQGKSGVDKTVVFGAVERGGDVRATIVKNTSAETLVPIILRWVKYNSTVYSDEASAYSQLGNWYDHDFIRHRAKQYVDGDVFTNTIEGFWGIMKKGLKGVYQWASPKHLQRYVDEFVYRYNTRKLSDRMRFDGFLTRMENRLLYKELVYGR